MRKRIAELEAEVDRLAAENTTLAADQCHDGYAGDNGDHRCRERDRLAALLREARGTADDHINSGFGRDALKLIRDRIDAALGEGEQEDA